MAHPAGPSGFAFRSAVSFDERPKPSDALFDPLDADARTGEPQVARGLTRELPAEMPAHRCRAGLIAGECLECGILDEMVLAGPVVDRQLREPLHDPLRPNGSSETHGATSR